MDSSVRKVANDAKTEILGALHEYYVNEKQEPVYALRLASLMELIAAVEVG